MSTARDIFAFIGLWFSISIAVFGVWFVLVEVLRRHR